ncbi:RNA-binding S4 domain-containing protein [Pedobacter sp. NJ-S-72]
MWAIRLFKTRTLATEACKAGRVKFNGQNVKASVVVKPGDVYQVSKGIEKKIIEVVELLYTRVESKIAVTKYKDITPLEETQGYKTMYHSPVLIRDRGAGRPTKRDRREIDDLTGSLFDEDKKDE